MDKELIKRFIAWCLIIFGSVMTAGFIILLSGGWEIEAFVASIVIGITPLTSGVLMIRNANKRVKRLLQRKSEQDILKLAMQHQGRLTANEVAIKTRMSQDEARTKLEAMQEAGHAHLEVSSKGAIVYLFPGLLPDGKSGGETI